MTHFRFSCGECESHMSIWWDCNKPAIVSAMTRHVRRKHPEREATEVTLYDENMDILTIYRMERA